MTKITEFSVNCLMNTLFQSYKVFSVTSSFKMECAIFLFINFVCVYCSVLYDNWGISETDKTIISAEIISNYFHKYVNSEEVFLSISFTSSTDEQEYFQEDLLKNLVIHAEFDNFSYNILDKVDQLREGNKYAFNLIIIDESNSIK